MSLREYCLASHDEGEECRPPSSQQNGDKITDALQSQIIDAFETAIYQGMRPIDALAVILSWMSSEMMRIQGEQGNRPAR